MGLFSKIFLIGALSAMVTSAYSPPSEAARMLDRYRGYSELTNAASGMDIDLYTYNLTTWQMDHGGFSKAYAEKYRNPWNGEAKSGWKVNGKDLGTIDNDATVQEMILLALRYKETSNNTYKNAFRDSFRKALEYLFSAQYPSGGWPQVYPARNNYSDMVTFNDNAMVRLMVMLKDILDARPPFDSDIATSAQIGELQASLNLGVDYILKAQIINDGKPTVWCAQHNPSNYGPEPARAYELKSKSGAESGGVVWFLMNWPDQSTAVQNAVKGALNWYEDTKVSDMKYNRGTFVPTPGASMWYRFYEVHNNDHFFCDRNGESSKTQDIMKIDEERRLGYQWAGDYGSKLLSVKDDYLNAIASLTPDEPSSSSSSEEQSSSSVVEVPEFALCGSETCSQVLEGEDFCSVIGVFEDKNAGFMGRGYVNVDNEVGSRVTYVLKATQDVQTTLYIRYANGGNAVRNGKISQNDVVLHADMEFPSTGAWTNWEILPVTVNFTAGTHDFTLTSLTEDGLPNIDWIAWNNNEIKVISSCELPTISQQKASMPLAQIRINRGDLHWQNVANGSVLNIKHINGVVAQQHYISGSGQQNIALPQGLYIMELQQNSTTQRWLIPHR